jgi:hypothetical protein
MRWTDEPDQKDKSLLHHALMLDHSDPLLPAYVEYWKRILSDGCRDASGSDWMSLSIDIYDRQVEGDELGYMHAMFRNVQKKSARGFGHFFLRGDAFDCIHPDGEDNEDLNRTEIRWLLQQYSVLKEAAVTTEVRLLLERIIAIRPLPITAATSYGWFDLQLGQDTFGPLPSEDEAMLAGNDRPPVNPLEDLEGEIMAVH